MHLHLHVGAAKTGTSTLQATLLDHREALRAHKLLVPSNLFNFSRNHNLLVCSVLEEAQWPRQFKGRALHDKTEALWSGIERERAGSDAGAAILSAEYISTLPPESMARLHARLRTLFDSVSVIVYVRDPADYYLSVSQQRVKASHVCAHPSRFKSPMRRIVTNLRDVFDDLRVRKFERSALRGGCIVADFLSAITPEGEAIVEGWEITDRNESLSAEGMCVMQRYRAANHADQNHVLTPEGRQVLAAIAAIPGQSGARLRAGIADALRAAHRKDNGWFRAKYGIAFPEPSGEAALPEGWSSGDLEKILDVSTDQVRAVADQVIGRLAAFRTGSAQSSFRRISAARRRRRMAG